MLQTGLRVGEALHLQVADVTLHDRSGHVRVRLGKGGKEREVPLNISARRALRAYLDSRPDVAPDESLFLSHENHALSERSVETLVRTLARRAKIERLRVTPHTLRHTFAHNFLRDNPGQMVELAQLLCHESLDTTAIYTRPAAEDLAAALEKSRLNVYG